MGLLKYVWNIQFYINFVWKFLEQGRFIWMKKNKMLPSWPKSVLGCLTNTAVMSRFILWIGALTTFSEVCNFKLISKRFFWIEEIIGKKWTNEGKDRTFWEKLEKEECSCSNPWSRHPFSIEGRTSERQQTMTNLTDDDGYLSNDDVDDLPDRPH